MNKLISNNPILKFKLGLKILKMLYGGKKKKLVYNYKPHEIKGGRVNGLPTGWVEIPGKGYLAVDPLGNAYKYDVRNGDMVLMKISNYDRQHIYNSINNGNLSSFSRGRANEVADAWLENRSKWGNRVVRNPIENKIIIVDGTKYQLNSDGTRISGPTVASIEKPVSATTLGTGTRIRTKVTPTTTSLPTYYATRKYRGKIPVAELNSRQAVMDYLRNVLGLTGAAVDGIWGDNTQAAYNKYLLSSALLSTKPAEIITSKPLNTTISPEILAKTIALSNPNPIYDRSMTRDWIRNNLKINPYNVSGAQRRALRYWLNGDREGLNYDKNILGVFGDLTRFAKKGGTLISKNPVERFLLGRSLPTTPSVKKRYSGGYRYLIPWMKKVRGPKTSMLVHPGEIYLYVKEVTPYYNDTTYVEIPEHTSFVDVKPRVASTNSEEDLNSPILDKNGWPIGHYKFKFNNSPEYETLKRRFNTAWSLAK